MPFNGVHSPYLRYRRPSSVSPFGLTASPQGKPGDSCSIFYHSMYPIQKSDLGRASVASPYKGAVQLAAHRRTPPPQKLRRGHWYDLCAPVLWRPTGDIYKIYTVCGELGNPRLGNPDVFPGADFACNIPGCHNSAVAPQAYSAIVSCCYCNDILPAADITSSVIVISHRNHGAIAS